MKIMVNHGSAKPRKPHASNSVKTRAKSLIKNKSIDAQSRILIRYGLETNDPWLPELVRHADAGESIVEWLKSRSERELLAAN
jgi:hypothetical protein